MSKSIRIDDDAYNLLLKISMHRKLVYIKASELPRTMSKIVSELIRKEFKEEYENE